MSNSDNIISLINSLDNYKLPDDYKFEYKDDDKLPDDYKPIEIKPDNLISTINSIDNYKLRIVYQSLSASPKRV